MARNNQQFTTIRTEGALLPPDILQRIASQKVDGVRPADYHLPEGFKITEAITQSWDILKKHWKSFQEAREHLANSDTGTSLTNERWLLPLFRELDYGRLTTQTSPVIEDRVYPIERFYHKTPIHLIGCNLFLDRRTKGARGAATASPHSMVQEYLNRSDDHLWAFLSNGRQLRLLRDNVALSRQAYVEFDLEAMMEGEVYSDFALLWMLCHQSRLETEKTDECWLEKWSKLAREDGTRVLKDLRNGVGNAIEALGRGFIGHPQNDDLRRKLQESGSLSKNEFYRQLLRIVYRLLFLFVAEDRELLHPPVADDADDKTREQHRKATELYRKYYSTGRLREMSLKLRGSKHGDLWHSLSLVFESLGRNNGCSRLGLVGLGSFLWNTESVADVAGPHEVDGDSIPVHIANDDLLTAIRALAFVEQDKVLRSVDYRNLGSEELGSVYESLLELHPDMHVEARHFELRTAAGNERKTTGSYYTPDSLVQCLLDSALNPVVEDRLNGKKGQDAEEAILSLKVCDPACGSGHFLIAAAHRLARQLARIRTGESEPSPEDYQHALRDVIGRCIYGVDINPMAVELCKVSLWMEAIEPGKPLSFLDHHIQCGNSLLGTTPKLLADGIPNEAFKAIEGDVKAVVNDLKKQNRRERKDYEQGQGDLFEPFIKLGNLPSEFSRLSIADDDSIVDIAHKEQRYEELIKSVDYQNARLLADLWCAVFVWKKDYSDIGKMCPTERDFRKIENNPHSILPHVESEVRRLAELYQLFHWQLVYPEVFRLPPKGEKAENEQTGWSGGFDVVLGNPPWERYKVQDKEWFASRAPEVATARNAAVRKKLIELLATESREVFAEYVADRRKAEATSALVRQSGSFPLCGRGDVNTYSIFAELNRYITSGNGRVGCIVPTGIATDDTTRFFFQDLMANAEIAHLFSFWEIRRFFPGTDSRISFCLLTLAKGRNRAASGEFAFDLHSLTELADSARRFELKQSDIWLFNPVSGTCPVFTLRQDFILSRLFHSLTTPLEHSKWTGFYMRLIDMGDHSEHLLGIDDISNAHLDEMFQIESNGHRYEKLYEAKLINLFDHRFASFDGVRHADLEAGNPREVAATEHELPHVFVKPRYWVESHIFKEIYAKYENQNGWLLAYRDITNSASERTCVTSAIPVGPATRSLPVLGLNPNSERFLALANLGAFCFDYAIRQKVGGNHLTFGIVKQSPILPPEFYKIHSLKSFLLTHVLELTFTAWDLESFALDCCYDGPPFRWDEERRFQIQCELDAAYFHLYLGPPSEWGADSPQLREMFPTPREAVNYIMETFPIVRRKDEAKYDGDYRTKRVILEIYDEMAEAIRTGQPYQSRLDPLPGPPVDAAGTFIPMSQWNAEHWPSHIHLPRVARQRVGQGRLVLDLLLLLEAWKQPVSITALEPALLLMRNDAARKALLEQELTPSESSAIQSEPHFFTGIDRIYSAVEANGAIRRVGENGYELANPDLLNNASQADRDRAAEVIRATAQLSELRNLPNIVAELTDERYQVTV